MATTPPRPTIVTGVDRYPLPQHFTVPEPSNAHAVTPPDVIARTPVRPATLTGCDDVFSVPFPS